MIFDRPDIVVVEVPLPKGGGTTTAKNPISPASTLRRFHLRGLRQNGGTRHNQAGLNTSEAGWSNSPNPADDHLVPR